MRILVVGNLYPPVVFGGYEILCEQVVNRLRMRGHDVRVLTSSFSKETAPPDPRVQRDLALTTSFPKAGEDVSFVDFRLRTMHRIGKGNYRITRKALRRNPVDLVFCWSLNRLSLGAVAAAQDAGIPVCYTVNDEHPRQFRAADVKLGLRNRLKAFLERWVWPLSTLRGRGPIHMTVISEALRGSLQRQGFPMDTAEVIHQGVPMEDFPFRPLAREDGEPLRLLYAGQLSRAKGVHTLLRAVGRLKAGGRHDFHLNIAGTGVPAYRAELASILEEEGLSGWVTFIGQIPHGRMTSVYQDHHVLVFPSEWEEPFGLSHVEAMACGTSVVSTTTGGSAELIRHGENALAFEAGNAVDLETQIRLLLDSDEDRCRIVEGGREWVEEHHSLDRYADRLEDFLERVHGGRSRNVPSWVTHPESEQISIPPQQALPR
jgi:glycosyltransferase involved in cell wall biosynthesis